MTLTATDPRIASFLAHFRDRVAKSPDLYLAGEDTLNVTLPSDLLGFANASAGHSGFGAGARPIGIRRKVDSARSMRDRIFSGSGEELVTFLLSSECDAHEYIESIRNGTRKPKTRKAKVVAKNIDVPATNNMTEHFAMADVKALAKSMGGAEQFQAYLVGKTIRQVAEERNLTLI